MFKLRVRDLERLREPVVVIGRYKPFPTIIFDDDFMLELTKRGDIPDPCDI